MTANSPARITLSSEEAAVLFELLSRWTEGTGPTPTAECFESPAECVVLNSALAQLERQVVASFQADYARVIQEARQRLAGDWTGSTLRG